MAPLYTLHTTGDSVLSLALVNRRLAVGTDGVCSTWMAVWALRRGRWTCHGDTDIEPSALLQTSRGWRSVQCGLAVGTLAGDAASVQEERVRHREIGATGVECLCTSTSGSQLELDFVSFSVKRNYNWLRAFACVVERAHENSSKSRCVA